MLRSSAAARRLLAGNRSSINLSTFLRFSTAATASPDHHHHHQQQQQQQQHDEFQPPPPPGSSARWEHEQGERRRGGATGWRRMVGDYEEEQARVLRSALPHVLRLGWSESALILGAKDVGISPSIIGTLPRKEAMLVEFFMDECLERLIDEIESDEELKTLIISERLSKLIRTRLEMQVPYISKWAQALSIQAQPANLPTSFKQRAMLVDEIWHAAGDRGSDLDWYVKRTVLGGIYSTTEVYMLTDHSPEFRDTRRFLDHRIRDAFDFQKTVKEATYLAEAVGEGVGNSMQGFMNRILQG